MANRGVVLALPLILVLTTSCRSLIVVDGGVERGFSQALLGPSVDRSERAEEEAAVDEALRGLSFQGGRVVVTGGKGEGVPVDRLLAEGYAQVERGRSIEAVRAFAAAGRAAPNQPVAYEALAKALVRRHRLEQAMDCLRTATALDPTRVTPHYEMARVERMRGKLHEAIRGWQRVLELEPDHGRAHARLAAALWHAGEVEGARHHYRRARELDGMPARQLEALLAGDRSADVAFRAAAAAPQISAPVQVDIDGAHAAEVSLAAVGNRVVVAWNDEREPGTNGGWRLGVAMSEDAGVTWSSQLLRPPGVSAADSHGDPMTAVDPVTGDLWVGGIDFGQGGQTYLARWPPTNPGLAPAVTVYDGGSDKAFAAAGPSPDLPGVTLLHVADLFQGLQTSADRGATWSDKIPLGPEGGFDVGHLPRVDADGRLYIVFWDFDDGIWLHRSLDGGTTVEPARRIATRLDPWDIPDGSRFPGLFRVPPLPYMTIDPAGRLYVVWFDTTSVSGGNSDVDLYFIRSDDHGVNWTAPRVLPRSGDQFFSWIEADGSGRLHMLWYDTRHTVQADDAPHGMIDVYYGWSEDQGDTWSETRLTSAPFDSFGMEWQLFDRQFLGDYLGLAVTGQRAYAAYPTSAAGELDVVVQRIDFPSATGTCQASSTALCLTGGRFRVETTWETSNGNQGLGKAVNLTDQTGYFWFFGADNVEVVVKVLDGCPVNNRKWVFLSGLTDVRVVTTVTDTKTGAIKTYENPQGRPFRLVPDTSAFDTCP